MINSIDDQGLREEKLYLHGEVFLACRICGSELVPCKAIDSIGDHYECLNCNRKIFLNLANILELENDGLDNARLPPYPIKTSGNTIEDGFHILSALVHMKNLSWLTLEEIAIKMGYTETKLGDMFYCLNAPALSEIVKFGQATGWEVSLSYRKLEKDNQVEQPIKQPSTLTESLWEQINSGEREYAEITTPHLDRNNDYIQIYLKKHEDGFLLTDDGATIGGLAQEGYVLDSNKRRKLLQITLNGYGVTCDGNALQVKANQGNFVLNKHNLVQAMLAVNDMERLE